ncbi:MAG: hypothetical protein VX737_02810, partial [Pseudomonadota bacterium]|nr:hypothetical protein [Pseudomonadota bacterium]
IEVKDAHVATNPALIPQLIVGQSLFTMGSATDNAVSKKDMLSISAMNNVSGGGLGFFLFQNLINLPSATADLTDGTIRFADLDDTDDAKYGTASYDQSVLNQSIMLAGQTFNGNGASALSLIKYGVGLGKTTADGDGTDYGTGTTNFPISLENAALGIMPADFINTNLLAVVTQENSSTPDNMAGNYTAFYKPLATNKITYYTPATRPSGTFYSHLLGMPKEMSATSDLSLLSHTAYTSQLTASTTLLPATDATATTDVFRLATAKAAFTTGANTLTGYEMFKFVELLTEPITPSVNSTFTKLKTKA